MTTPLDDLFEGCPETMEPGEVAVLLGRSKQSIYNWLNTATIPGYKIGNSWFILRDELKAHLEAGSNQGPKTGPKN